MAELPVGTRLKTDGGLEIEVVKELGRGGQGVVYQVRMDGEFKALKWYHESNVWSGYADLKKRVEIGSPGECFLWPQDTLISEEYHSYGCIMEIRPAGYVSMTKLLIREKFDSDRACVEAMIHLAVSFRLLHNQGLIYQSLSDEDIWINPHDGNILIGSCENISYLGDSIPILGQSRYTAPEVVLGQKTPDRNTDNFLLAVLLFELACKAHPLEGAGAMPPCMTPSTERWIYGGHPVFIFDPEDESNHPIPGIHTNAIKLWPRLPDYVQGAFERAFSKGAMTYDPERYLYAASRLQPREWLDILEQYRDSLPDSACDPQETTQVRNKNEKTKRILPLYFVVDTTGNVYRHVKRILSMKMLRRLQDISKEYPEVEIRLAILKLFCGCDWCTQDALACKGLTSLDSFYWEDSAEYGMTAMGEAFRELDAVLSRTADSLSGEEICAPIILLLSENVPSDGWKGGLSVLQQNPWFRRATKLAISVDCEEHDALDAFAGAPENVAVIHGYWNQEHLARVLCGLAENASLIQIRNPDSMPDEEEARRRAYEAVLETDVGKEEIWDPLSW